MQNPTSGIIVDIQNVLTQVVSGDGTQNPTLTSTSFLEFVQLI